MGWTDWRKVAEGTNWFDEDFDYEGPACYELAIAGPKGGELETAYVGETDNERRRISDYARHGSHLKKDIDRALRNGWSLWYRGWLKKTKREAKAMQDRLLDEFDYPWNKVENRKWRLNGS